MKRFKKFIIMLLVVLTMITLTTLTTHAISLDYSGGSSFNNTGASPTTSGFSVSYDDADKNICGYRFSVVTSSGTPKSGTKVVNIYLSDIDDGNTAYSSAQRFIISSGKVANKKQLANETKVSSTSSKQSCDYKSGDCGFYSTLPQSPSSVGSWIKKSTNSYQNLSRIYVLCGTNLSKATESDYVLIEPIFWPRLAGTKTAATATELALYGAAISGGDGYNGANGALTDAGAESIKNICNYINREFPNSLYVDSDTDVYSAVTIKTSGRYTYKQIIQKGFGCSVLTVKNIITVNKVKIAYHPNGGTTSIAAINSNGFMVLEDSAWIQSISYGKKADPYNASTFGLTRKGYSFGGWEVKSTGKQLDQSTEYDSTVYAQHDDETKTTENTKTVYCHLYAVWVPNTVKLAYHPNGGTTSIATINSNGFMVLEDSAWIQSISYGKKTDPYNASTFGLTRKGYNFGGWEVKSTGKQLDPNTEYDSTVYAQYDNETKTTANTKTVYCHLYAIWVPNTVKLAYHPNGGTTNIATINSSGLMVLEDSAWIQSINYGKKADPYNASTFGLTRKGYSFGGWEVKSTGKQLDPNTEYDSTVYAQYDNETKTTANTKTVYCHLYAVWVPNTVKLAYHPNGGTVSTATINSSGFLVLKDSAWIQSINYGKKTDPCNASTFGLTKAGYSFGGWEVKSTGKQLDQSTEYDSTIYAQHDDETKTTANTKTVYCHLYAIWVPNTVKLAYHPNGGTVSTATINSSGFMVLEDSAWIHSVSYGNKADPYNASTFGLTRTGYEFKGWEVKSTGKQLDQNTEYDSTVYAQHDDETKTTENTKTVYCHLYAAWEEDSKIVIVPIEPNASYRENTDVISSFWLVNISGKDYTPATGATVEFSVFDSSGEKIAEESQSFVAPKDDKNLAYFKWHVPNGLRGTDVTVKAHIVEGASKYSHTERIYRVASFDTCKTPDTSYDAKAPEDFEIPDMPPNDTLSARWWKWEYEGGSFIKKEYGTTNSVNNVTLTTPTNPTAYISGGTLHMKSGYGFECGFTNNMSNVSGYEATSINHCIAPQYFYALFPEYNYTYGANQCRSFETVSGRKVFLNATGMNRQHFTPIYFPDGEYKFQIVLSDCWTPAGMLTTYKTVTIQIGGNMYDDWYVGRKEIN